MLAVSLAIPSVASASTATTATTVVVSSAGLVTGSPAPGQFVVINQSGGLGGVGLLFGPATPPLGSGSLQMAVTGSGDHWSVYNYDHVGTKLSDITALGYSTYTDNSTTDPILQMEINPGNTTGADAGVTYSTLNFEPYLQECRCHSKQLAVLGRAVRKGVGHPSDRRTRRPSPLLGQLSRHLSECNDQGWVRHGCRRRLVGDDRRGGCPDDRHCSSDDDL